MDLRDTFLIDSGADRYGAALVDAAQARNEALRTERLYKRVVAQCLLAADGKNATEKDAAARTHIKAVSAEDAWVEAETAFNLARAKADALQVRWETWRTEQANRRQEMKL